MNLHYYSIRHKKIHLDNKANVSITPIRMCALVVGTSSSSVKGVASIPITQLTQDSCPKQEMNSRGNVVTNSIKTLKKGDGPHQNDLII